MNYSIKELPEQERPREKLKKRDVSSLTKVELLSIILRTGTRGKNVKQLSAEVLNSYTLGNLAERPLDQLEKIEGVSEVKGGQLKALSELARRMQLEEKDKIESFSDIKEMVEDMKYMEEEILRVFVLSSGNEVLGKKEIEGSVSKLEFGPRDILGEALKRNGSAVILVHNHPSKSSRPTQPDINTTEKIIETGNKLGIEILDHVIVGEEISSMRKTTDIQF